MTYVIYLHIIGHVHSEETMPAKTSAEMLKARKLIESGCRAAVAARKVGLTPQSVYVSKWWKQRKEK